MGAIAELVLFFALMPSLFCLCCGDALARGSSESPICVAHMRVSALRFLILLVLCFVRARVVSVRSRVVLVVFSSREGLSR